MTKEQDGPQGPDGRKGNGKPWTNKDESGDLQNKEGVLREERVCRRMPEYTNFNQTSPPNAKDVQVGDSGLSPDVKAGFPDVRSPPVGLRGRDFLSEQPRYLRKSRDLDPGGCASRCALTREDVRPLAGVHGLCGHPRKTSWRDDLWSSKKWDECYD